MVPSARALALAACAVFATAEPAPPGYVRGELISAGEELLRVRSAGAQYECGIDEHTLVERYGVQVRRTDLRAGDPVEVLADRTRGGCYLRTVRVAAPARGMRMRTAPSAIERWSPRGDIAFAGVVLRRNPELIVLRTNSGDETALVVRNDTRFSRSGLPAALSDLPVNARVFIRAGRSLDQELEAYQVVWGKIEGP